MILTYDLILFLGVFVFCILVACIFRIIELSKQEKDWLPETTDEEAITGFSSSAADEDDQQGSRRSSPFPSFLLPSSMQEKERNRFQEHISGDSQCNITPNPLNHPPTHPSTHPYKKPAIPGSAVPFAAPLSSPPPMQSIQPGRPSESMNSNHSGRSKQMQTKQRSNQPVRSSESKQIAMRYFNVKSLDEIKDNETEPYIDSIPEMKRHPRDVEQVGSKVQRQKVSEYQSANKRQIYYNNNMIPSNDESSSSSETVYQSNQHEIGSVEAEFYNDFISIFPMRQLELRPDFNLLSKH